MVQLDSLCGFSENGRCWHGTVRKVAMKRHIHVLFFISLAFLLSGCGGGSGGGNGGGTPPSIPSLTSIAPSSATAGAVAISLNLFGSNFENGATVQWNGPALPSTWISSTQMSATVPAGDVVNSGSADVTVTNPSPGGGTSAAQIFKISAASAATTWVRSVPGITTAQNIVWDSAHGSLYVSIPSTDTSIPNTIVPINPLTATAGKPVPAGNNPARLSISPDSSFLWVGIDGDNAVQRFLLPGLTKDISFTLPTDPSGNAQRAVDLEAARINPHSVALVAENINFETGQGVFVFDDAVRRPAFVPSRGLAGGAYIDWIQWGANDSTIYASQSLTIDAGGVATLNVSPSGVSLGSYNGGMVGPPYSLQYEKNNGLLYSYGGAYNPVSGALLGRYNLPVGEKVCTADSVLGRYYCVDAFSDGGTDVNLFELWIFDLNNYTLIDRVYFGASAGQTPSIITGSPQQLVRWGNAGLALTTNTAAYYGNGGLFLIDGAAVNPKASPDVSSGSPPFSYSWMSSLAPLQATAGGSDVAVTISGNNFTSSSTACWGCSYIQFRLLPTSYVSPQQLTMTIPASMLASPGLLPISVFDSSTNLFSTDALTFSVNPAPASPEGGTKVTPVGLAGLGMAWDSLSSLLYVGTSESDGSYPNSIVAVNPINGSVVRAQTVSSNPDLVSVSANGQFLYTAYAGATTMSQLQLPGLGSPLTWALTDPGSSSLYWAGDLRAAPVNPHTTAATLLEIDFTPQETGGVVVYDDNVGRPDFVTGFGGSFNIYDAVAWGSSDQILTGACFYGCLSNTPVSPLYEFQVTQSGAALVATGTAPFTSGQIHSDFGTGLIYSDDGNVADPTTQAIVGAYNASGLVAPDSSLNRVFILGQTATQGGTNDYTIESFDEKAFTSISSITVNNFLGSRIELIRWGSSGLAVLTIDQGGSGSQGMLYVIQDSNFVSTAVPAASRPRELVKRRWKFISKADLVKMVQARRAVKSQ